MVRHTSLIEVDSKHSLVNLTQCSRNVLLRRLERIVARCVKVQTDCSKMCKSANEGGRFELKGSFEWRARDQFAMSRPD